MATTRGARANKTTPTITQALAELRTQADAIRRSIGVVARSAKLALSASRAKSATKPTTRASAAASRSTKTGKPSAARKTGVVGRSSPAKSMSGRTRTAPRRAGSKTAAL